jgi:hypothetical protein
MTRNPSEVEQAVSRTLRDSLAKLQQTSGELNQAVNDLVSACASARPSNSLPPMLRARSAAASLAASLEVLSKFVITSLQSASAPADEEEELLAAAPRTAAPSASAAVIEPAAAILIESIAALAPVGPADQIEPPIAPEAPIAAEALVVPEERLEAVEPINRVEVELAEPALAAEPPLADPPPAAAPTAELPLAVAAAPLAEVAPPPAEVKQPEAPPTPETPPTPESEWAQPLEPAAAALETELAPVAALSIDGSSAPFPASHSEELPPEAAGFNVLTLAPEQQELHRRANRVAKVSMQDVKMLRPVDVALGREHKDLCIRLRDDIEKAHREYDRRFHAIVDHPVDYFYDWMVEILGGGDPQTLGEYPYPTPVLRR